MSNVLFVTTVSSTLSAFLLPFAEHFRELGWRVDAAAFDITKNKECVKTFDSVFEIHASRSPRDIGNILRLPRDIKAVVELGEYDIVHVHTPIAAFVTRYAIRKLKKNGRPKVIYTAHGFHFYEGGSKLKNMIFLAIERLAGKWTDYLVIMNREDETAAYLHGIIPEERVLFMHGIGVDTNFYSPERCASADVKSVRDGIGITEEQPLFLMVAGLIPRKRHRDAFHALSLLKDKNAHLALAGTGSLEGDLRELSCELGIADQVHFLGVRRDIPALVQSSVALLLPSTHEGLPRSIMEALSLERPVIGSDIRGTRDLLEDGCGLLFEVGDIEGLTKAMSWVLEHPEEARTIGKRGRRKMRGDYELSNIIQRHDELYQKALGVDHADAKSKIRA